MRWRNGNCNNDRPAGKREYECRCLPKGCDLMNNFTKHCFSCYAIGYTLIPGSSRSQE
jgi:hypothetical protein